MAAGKKKKSGIKIKPSKVGSLRKATGTSPTGDMPEKDKQIKKGDSPAMRKKKTFALNAAKWSKGKRSK